MRPRLRARVLLRLLHAALVALALLTAGARARAAVPMCSDDGRTVAAPPIMRPSPTRVLESTGDCERLRLLLSRSSSGDHRGGPQSIGDAPLRAVPAITFLPAAERHERIAVVDEVVAPRNATTDDVFRPPRR